MLRNSRGITPRNNLLLDTFWGLIGTVSAPLSPHTSFVGRCRSEADP